VKEKKQKRGGKKKGGEKGENEKGNVAHSRQMRASSTCRRATFYDKSLFPGSIEEERKGEKEEGGREGAWPALPWVITEGTEHKRLPMKRGKRRKRADAHPKFVSNGAALGGWERLARIHAGRDLKLTARERGEKKRKRKRRVELLPRRRPWYQKRAVVGAEGVPPS